MPYITTLGRQCVDDGVATTPGELNYAITREIGRYLQIRLEAQGKLGYTDLNDVLGALDGAKQEFYRIVVVPYEEDKRAVNGDVIPKTVLDFVRSR